MPQIDANPNIEEPSSPVSATYFDASERLLQPTNLPPDAADADDESSCKATADAPSPSPDSPINTDEDSKHLSLNESLPNPSLDTTISTQEEQILATTLLSVADALKQAQVAGLPDSPAKNSPNKKDRTKTATPPPPSPTFHRFVDLPWPIQARVIELACEGSHSIQFCNYTHSTKRLKRIQAMNNTMAPYKTQKDFYKLGSRHYCRHNTFSFPHHVAASAIKFLGIVGRSNWDNLRSIAFPIDSVTIWAICLELLRGLHEITFVVDCRERYNFDMRFFHRVRLLCDASPLIAKCILGLADSSTWPAYDENYTPGAEEEEQMTISTLQDFFGALNRWLDVRNDPLMGHIEKYDYYLAACHVMVEKVRLGESIYHTRISNESKAWFRLMEPPEGYKYLDIHHPVERKLDVYIPCQPKWGKVEEPEEKEEEVEEIETTGRRIERESLTLVEALLDGPLQALTITEQSGQ